MSDGAIHTPTCGCSSCSARKRSDGGKVAKDRGKATKKADKDHLKALKIKPMLRD
jgi:hypothetical protein